MGLDSHQTVLAGEETMLGKRGTEMPNSPATKSWAQRGYPARHAQRISTRKTRAVHGL
jgi:hypothetical protein